MKNEKNGRVGLRNKKREPTSGIKKGNICFFSFNYFFSAQLFFPFRPTLSWRESRGYCIERGWCSTAESTPGSFDLELL